MIWPPHVNNGRSVATHRHKAARWGPDGLPVGAPDRRGGARGGGRGWRRPGRARRLLARPMTGGEVLAGFSACRGGVADRGGGAERLCVRPGTLGQDRSDRLGRDRLESSACQRPAARPQPRAACVLAACSCRNRRPVPTETKGPGRPGRIGLAFLIAGEDSRPRFEQARPARCREDPSVPVPASGSSPDTWMKSRRQRGLRRSEA